MKKLTTLFVMLAFHVSAQYQNPTRLDQIPYDAEISIILENQNQNNISFLPLFKNFSGIPENVLTDEQIFIEWLTDTCTNTHPDDCIMAISHRLVKLLKGDVFVNNALYPSHWSHLQEDAFKQAFAKDYAMVGALSGTYTMQCGNYAQIAASLYQKTGLVDTSFLRIINSGSHVFLEIFHENRWKIVDYDPGTLMFMTKNQLSHEDLRLMGVQGAVNEISVYEFTDFYGNMVTKKLDDSLELEIYFQQLTLQGGFPIYPPLFHETYEISGDIVLPPYGKVLIEYKNKEVFIDGFFENDTLMYHFQSAVYAFENGNMTDFHFHLDTTAKIIEHLTGINSEIIKERALSGEFLVSDSPNFHPKYQRDQIPFYTLVIPPGNYRIGVDVKAPGKVLSVELSSGQILLQDSYGNDTLIHGLQPYEVHFWELQADTSRHIPNSANHYLNEGWISSSDTVKIKVSWNPILFPFLHGELNIHCPNGDTLSRQYLLNGVSFNSHSLGVDGDGHISNENDVKFYPNPTTKSIFLSQPSDVKIFSVTGEEVLVKNQALWIDTSGLIPGTYILQIGNVRKKVIKQ